jgi:hypothetical protein
MTERKLMLAAMLLTLTAAPATAQTDATPVKRSARAKHKSPEQEQIEQMDERIQKLEQMVSEMHQQLASSQQQLEAAKKDVAQAKAATQAGAGAEQARESETLEQVKKQSDAIAALQSSVSTIETSNVTLDKTVQSEQTQVSSLLMPDGIRFLGVTLKPGGFLAAETVNRQRAIGGDVNTQFSGIPFAGQTAADFTEFNASGRQSRISLLAEGKLSHATLRGFYEADFLSAGTTSNDNQSNSYSLRQRQVWAQAQLESGLTFTGGQMWSLVTETRKGVTNTTEATPMTIDSQYNVGFAWERQYGFRVSQRIGQKFWVAGAVEEAQTLNIGGHNLPALVYQQAGNSGGLYNPSSNYSYNLAPDLLAKAVWEPGIGHYEIFAVGRFFRARVFPNAVSLNGAAASTTPTAGAFTSKAYGGGAGLNARVPLFQKHLELGAHILAGDGLGRYGTTTLADATEHANGSLELLAGGSALGSIEYHATPRLDLYAYYGGEYVKRAFYNTGLTVTSGVNVGQPILTGYGAPTNNVSGCHTEVAPVTSANGGGFVPGTAVNCTADNRDIQEGTVGYWFRFYRGNKGTLQQGLQYSYAERHTWLGIGDPLSGLGGSPKAIDNMVFTSFRYYLPTPPQ